MQQALVELHDTIEEVQLDLSKQIDDHVSEAFNQHNKKMAHDGMTQTERDGFKDYIRHIVQLEVNNSLQRAGNKIAQSFQIIPKE